MRTSLKVHAVRSIPPLVIGFLAFTASACAEFNHSVFDNLLKSSVKNGRVAYGNFKNNTDFNSYLQSLVTADLKSMSEDEELAFWINAYNANVIKNVLDHPGIKKPLDVPGFFDKIKFRVAGADRTLNDIENGVIRAKYKTPYIHFGLVCAARSCPPLIPMAYTAGNVRSQLEQNARAYLANSEQNRYDAGRNVLKLSQILDWYKDDFGGAAGTREFVKKEGPESWKEKINDRTRLEWIEYNWTLNAQ